MTRSTTPNIEKLEHRELLTIVRPQIALAAIPPVLPNRGGISTVSIVGQIASTRETVNEGFFQVTDQYRVDEPHGPVSLIPLGARDGYYRFGFEFNLNLQSQARSNTPSGGRQYFVLVGATDADNTEGQTITVFVPGSRGPSLGPMRPSRFTRFRR